MATVRGGKRFKARLDKIAENVGGGATLQVGFLEGATYPETGVSVPLVAAVNEFGSPGRNPPQPPRPFFRHMIAEKKGEWPAAAKVLLRDYDYDVVRTLDKIGEAIAGQLRESITTAGSFVEPLRPATIKRKGFATPLIDTSTMLNSVSHIVVTSED